MRCHKHDQSFDQCQSVLTHHCSPRTATHSPMAHAQYIQSMQPHSMPAPVVGVACASPVQIRHDMQHSKHTEHQTPLHRVMCWHCIDKVVFLSCCTTHLQHAVNMHRICRHAQTLSDHVGPARHWYDPNCSPAAHTTAPKVPASHVGRGGAGLPAICDHACSGCTPEGHQSCQAG